MISNTKSKVYTPNPNPRQNRGVEKFETREGHTFTRGAAEVEQQGSNITNSMQRPQQKQSHDTLGRHRTGKARGGQIRKYERAELAYATKREATAIDAGQG